MLFKNIKIDKKTVALWILFLPIMIIITLWKKNKLVIAAVFLIIISLILSVISISKPIVDEELVKQEEQLNKAKVSIEKKDYITAQIELNNLSNRRLGSEYKKEAKTLLESVNAEADKMKEQEKEEEDKNKRAQAEDAKKDADAKSASNEVINEELQKYYDERSIILLVCTGITENEANDILRDLKSVGINYINKCVDAKSANAEIEGIKVYEISYKNKKGILTMKSNKTFYIDYGGLLFDAAKGGVIKNTND